MNEATAFSFLNNSGHAAELVRNRAWEVTPLGGVHTWPVLLKASLATALNSPLPTAILWGEKKTVLFNDAFLESSGCLPETMGEPMEAAFPERQENILRSLKEAYSGKALVLEDFILQATKKPLAPLYLSPIFKADGETAGVQLTILAKTEHQDRVRNADLQHRLKNIFATINSIISQTMRGELPQAEIKSMLIQRISALSSAHAFALDTGKTLAMRPVLTAALGPHTPDHRNLTLEGPDLVLNEKQAISLFLGIHELVTNAVKYGALSQQSGAVAIRWHQPSPESLELNWQESGGPPVAQPAKKGFGSVLVERVLPHDFGGRAELIYAPEGLRYHLLTEQFSPP